jgi:cytochrome c556
MKAADAKDKDGIVAAGGDLNLTCDNCHARYSRQ